jgi:hypothetical protein
MMQNANGTDLQQSAFRKNNLTTDRLSGMTFPSRRKPLTLIFCCSVAGTLGCQLCWPAGADRRFPGRSSLLGLPPVKPVARCGTGGPCRRGQVGAGPVVETRPTAGTACRRRRSRRGPSQGLGGKPSLAIQQERAAPPPPSYGRCRQPPWRSRQPPTGGGLRHTAESPAEARPRSSRHADAAGPSAPQAEASLRRRRQSHPQPRRCRRLQPVRQCRHDGVCRCPREPRSSRLASSPLPPVARG